MILGVIETLDKTDDKELIEKLYNDYASWLRMRAYKLVPDAEACTDLVHDCIIKMIRHLDKIKTLSVEKQRAYLAVSIDNLAKNHLKHNSKIVIIKNDDLTDIDDVPDDTDIETQVDNKLNYEFVKENLDLLSSRDRDIIIMKYGLELTDSEMAAILNIQDSSVRVAVLRSVERLRKIVAKKVGYDE